MPKLIVVDNPDDWQFNLTDVEVITPSRYISGDAHPETKGVKVINLCKSYQYQSIGYYVSLLAEARKHKVLPGISTIQDLRFLLFKRGFQDFDDLIQASFKTVTQDKVEFDIYFGITQEEHLTSSRSNFSIIPAPSLMSRSRSEANGYAEYKTVELWRGTQEEMPLLHQAAEKYLQRNVKSVRTRRNMTWPS